MSLFTDKCKIYIPRLMQDLSITREQACGIFGNIGGETEGFAALQEKVPVVKGSRGGYGWLQWTGPRRKKYEAWCVKNNVDKASDEANYRYLVVETSTDELHSLLQLRKTSTVAAATETFMSQNLRPGKPNLAGRQKWAAQADEATKVIKIEEKKQTQQTGTVATIATAGAGMLYFFQNHWVLILGVCLAAGAIAWWVIHESHEQEKNKVLADQAKKGKK